METGTDLEKLGKARVRQKVAMRLGVWSCFIDSGGHLDVIVPPQALTYRPEGVDDETMYKTLALTLEQANHDQVNLRILENGPYASRERDGFGIMYMDGLAAGRSIGETVPAGSPSVVLLGGSSVDVLEGMWAEAEGAALSADASRSLIEETLRDFQHGAPR